MMLANKPPHAAELRTMPSMSHALLFQAEMDHLVSHGRQEGKRMIDAIARYTNAMGSVLRGTTIGVAIEMAGNVKLDFVRLGKFPR